MKWHINGDTLELLYDSRGEPYQYRIGDALRSTPMIYIMAPKLWAIYTDSASCKLTGWQAAHWLLKSEGRKSGVLIANSTVDSLSATIQSNGLLQIGTDNRMGYTQVQIKDTSSFIVEKDVFRSLHIEADSLADVKLPGVLFRQLVKQ